MLNKIILLKSHTGGHDALFDYMDRYMKIQNNNQNPKCIGLAWGAYR